MELELRRAERRFASPLRTAFGTLEARAVVEVRVRAADGAEGVGEAAPLEPYDGVALNDVEAALEACRDALRATDDGDREALLGACEALRPPPQALAAVDLALWDLAGRRAGLPVAALLAAAPAAVVAVNATIGAVGPVEAAAGAAAARAAGFECVKVKVGSGDDLGRVAAVREVLGPRAAIRLDANGAWEVPAAERALRELSISGIELCEEPVHGAAAFAALRERLDGLVPLAMDETAAEPGAVASGAAELVCLKIAACGGITGLGRAARAAREAGSEVYVASSLDGPAGIAAALHAAAALGELRPCGLATLGLFAGEEAALFPVVRGRIAVPEEPGLGVAAASG